MSKKLAIAGHPTRGNEVIEILGMLCGKHPYIKNIGIAKCNIKTDCYYMCDYGFISWSYIGPDEIDDFKIFTLEEFLERFPYKIGDEFCNPYDKITEMFWDEEDEIVYYKTEYSRYYVTTTDIMLDSYARSK